MTTMPNQPNYPDQINGAKTMSDTTQALELTHDHIHTLLGIGNPTEEESRLLRLGWIAGIEAVQAAAKCLHQIAEPAAWMDPVTMDVINDARKQAWARDYGAGGAAKAAAYTVALGPLAPAADARVDCIGLALELESQAKRVESQSVERAMLAAANGLRLMAYRSVPAVHAREVLAAPEFDVRTSAGGRGYVAWYFANVLKRHDFASYINGALAADFACALARHLQAAPSQEHATQLAGGEPTAKELVALSRECEKMRGGLGMHYENYARAVLARWGAAPAQAQEAAPALEAPAAFVRKPLAPEEIQAGHKAAGLEKMLDTFTMGVEFAEREHGVSAAAPQAPAAPMAVPEGWVLMPRKLPAELIYAALEGYYGKRRLADAGGPNGMDMTVNDVNYSGAAAFRRMWRGILAALQAAPAAPAVDAREDEHAKSVFNRGFNAATCVALQVLRGFGDTDSTAWNEIVKTAGRAEIENYAKNIAPENWELCGFAHIAAQAKGGA